MDTVIIKEKINGIKKPVLKLDFQFIPTKSEDYKCTYTTSNSVVGKIYIRQKQNDKWVGLILDVATMKKILFTGERNGFVKALNSLLRLKI